MIGRVAFVAFLLGLTVGAWIGLLETPAKQLPVRVDCAPAVERI